MSKRVVLVVDDHQDIRNLVREYLEASDFEVQTAASGDQAKQVLAQGNVDLMVLDLNMPGCDGFEVCRQLRRTSAIPVLVLSARSEDLDKILALELGADDYLTKPFNPRELVARVQAHFRRLAWDKATFTGQSKATLECGRLTFDQAGRQVWYQDKTLPLTPIEFLLLFHLARSAGQNLSRQHLLDKVWGPDFFGDERTVDAHVKSLRQKLRGADDTFRPIHSVWGVGYRFES